MKRALHDIRFEIEEIMEQAESKGGEISPLEAHLLDSLQMEEKEKISNIVWVVNSEVERLEACSKEIDRLKALQKSALRKIDWLRTYLGNCIGEGNKYDGGTFKLSWRKSEMVDVDMSVLPDQYKRYKTEESADKALIKEDLKNGAMIPGACLIERNNLQIK